MSLPSNFRQLAYIQSSGTQYINSLFTPNQNTRVFAKVYFPTTGSSGGTNGLFGVRPSSVTNCFEFSAYTGYYRTFYGSSIGSYATSVNMVGAFVIDKNKTTTTLGGANIDTRPTATFTAGGPLYIFAVNTVSAANYYSSARVYWFKIFNNGTLVRDFIPCKNESGAVGLWDDVEGKFYGNSGTGTFTAGNLVLREGEYEELEYLQSSGTQYIDSDFVPNQDTRVRAECVLPIASSTQGLFGCRVSSSSSQFQFVTQGGYYRSDYNTAINNFTTHDYGNGKFYIDKNKNVTDLNGEYSCTHTYGAFVCPGNMFIFATNNNGSVYALASAKLYSMQVYDNGLLERDYIPIRYLATGELGLLDRVYGAFYPNAGTGTFTAGDVYERDGYKALKYVESSGAQYVDTRFYPNQNSRVTASAFLVDKANSYPSPFGVRNGSSGQFWAFWAPSENQFHGRYNTQSLNIAATPGELDVYDFDRNSVTINGVNAKATAATFTSAYSLYLFAVNNAGSVQYYSKLRVHVLSAYDNGAVVRVYIPMRHYSGVAGLYDEENGRFYATATTTDLIAGPVAGPAEPENFRVTEAGYLELSLAWDASADATGYRLYRDGELIADITETSYTDTGVKPNGTYSYDLIAYNADGESKPVSLIAKTLEGYAVMEVYIDDARFSVNPVVVGGTTVLSVAVSEQLVIYTATPEILYSGEVYAGEV